MAVKPPKCRTCGREEWRHLCGGVPEIVMAKLKPEPVKRVPKRKVRR